MTNLTIEDALSMLKSGDMRISAKLIETEGLSGHQKKCAEFKAFLIRTLKEHARVVKDAVPKAVVTEVAKTAPERIFLQIAENADDCAQPFPPGTGEVTWCEESQLGCEVEYVRADLARIVE